MVIAKFNIPDIIFLFIDIMKGIVLKRNLCIIIRIFEYLPEN